jgi:hypothetical protein
VVGREQRGENGEESVAAEVAFPRRWRADGAAEVGRGTRGARQLWVRNTAPTPQSHTTRPPWLGVPLLYKLRLQQG